jgi:hypothetical protein
MTCGVRHEYRFPNTINILREHLNFLADEVHIIHVVARATYAIQYGAPPIDMAPPVDDKVCIITGP